MDSLENLLEDRQIGLTIYLPDCAHSRLWGNLDHKIETDTGFQIVQRQWFQHDINSILPFYNGINSNPPAKQDPAQAFYKYDNIPAQELQYGHLMVKMLLMGPSLVTLWQGKNAIPTLLTLKGKAQPAEAASGSIRGGFWCDNGVCNLMHTSDDVEDLKHELAVLNLDYWLKEEAKTIPLMPLNDFPQDFIAHSGIITLCNVINRLLLADGRMPEPFTLPPFGDAKETNIQLTHHLQAVSKRYSDLSLLIESFLSGDLIAVINMLSALPVTRWEYLVIQCGAVNRDKWQN